MMTLLAMWGDAWWSRAITKLTDGGPSHVAIGFDWLGDNGEYYEALFGRGVRGPIPYRYVQDWAAKSPDRVLKFWPLSGCRDLADRKRLTAEMWVGAVGYGHLQILAMLLRKKIGWNVRRSIGRVVCSEYVARVLWPEFDLRDGREFDEVTPANLWRSAQALAVGRPIQEAGDEHGC